MIAAELFQLPASLPFHKLLLPEMAPWEWLSKIKACLDIFAFPSEGPSVPPGVTLLGPVYMHPTVKLPSYAVIEGPCYLGAHTEVRPNAYLRGYVIAGEHCVLGHSGEFKNCLLMDHVQAPHRPYVGDSILGNGAHLGAGVVLANLRLDQKNVPVKLPEGRQDTGLRKMGAILGDHAEVGCNAVLQPGTILGKKALVFPCMSFGGYLPEGHRVSVDSKPIISN